MIRFSGSSPLPGVILSGILLAGNILIQSPILTSSVIHPTVKPLTIVSHSESVNIPKTTHNQLKLTTAKPIIEPTASKPKYFPTKIVKNVSRPSVHPSNPSNPSNPLHNLQLHQKSYHEIKQVSRGSDNFSNIVNHALSLVGTPYVFGGTTRRGFDCSGFTQYVFAGAGISLPRTSYEQFASGIAVSKENLQPGDLVFFTTYSKGASHVGIYIGKGNFVHADNPKVGVTITSLSNSYYAAHYLGARRYF